MGSFIFNMETQEKIINMKEHGFILFLLPLVLIMHLAPGSHNRRNYLPWVWTFHNALNSNL